MKMFSFMAPALPKGEPGTSKARSREKTNLDGGELIYFFNYPPKRPNTFMAQETLCGLAMVMAIRPYSAERLRRREEEQIVPAQVQPKLRVIVLPGTKEDENGIPNQPDEGRKDRASCS
jgi:hypothetical protein